jgi:quinol monooxygenase YgiN
VVSSESVVGQFFNTKGHRGQVNAVVLQFARFSGQNISDPLAGSATNASPYSAAGPRKLVIASVKTDPQKDASFHDALRDYRKAMRDCEPGTLQFDVYRHESDANSYTIIELYENDAAYAAHCRSPFRDSALQRIRATLLGGSATSHYSVD